MPVKLCFQCQSKALGQQQIQQQLIISPVFALKAALTWSLLNVLNWHGLWLVSTLFLLDCRLAKAKACYKVSGYWCHFV